MAFQPKKTDYILSPYTGMTRESWLEAAEYMLQGIFAHIENEEQPVVVPRQEREITYPHKWATAEDLQAEQKAEMFEGLTRSLFIAGPVIHNNPETVVQGIHLRNYYKKQILRTCTGGDSHCAGSYEELQELMGNTDPFRCFQQTVETGALVIGLWVTKDEIWEDYTKEEKDIIAHFLQSFAHANTVPQNWRMFNMLGMAFLYQAGYEIDEKIMLDHGQAILEYYVGDGWYRDGHSFDYYSCWAFNFYAPLWNRWYGYEKLPYIAKRFEENANELMKTYPDFFDRDGYTNMWGRSNIYRFAAVSPFDGNYYLNNSTVNPGVARRICSGSLLQFLGREDFCKDGIPTMGFYGQFAPLVQGYSCAESPFWMGKAFLCLHLPSDHPFWTATEEPGTWGSLKENEVKETILNGPGLAFTNHQANGETILRSAKVVKNQNDVHGMWNYSKLSYNTKYPWESTPKPLGADGQPVCDKGEVESQQYVLRDITTGNRSLCNITYWGGEKEKILYRRQYFDYRTDVETHWLQGIFLADFPVANGIMRVDKVKLHRRPVVLTLGSYGFPDNGTIIQEHEQDGAKAIVLVGKDATGQKKQMAMTVYGGWEQLKIVHSQGTNPDSEHSIVLYAEAELKTQYDGTESYVFISQVITKEDDVPFTREELFPIQKIQYTDEAGKGTFGPVTITLRDESVRRIDYEGMEGGLSL